MTRQIKIFWGWSFAILGSIILNIALFALMPGLIQKTPLKPDSFENINQVQVIRVIKPEILPPKKKDRNKEKKPILDKKIQKPTRSLQQNTPQHIQKTRSLNIQPTLAFELNTKLPAAPIDLVMPDIEQYSMDIPVQKDFYGIDELDSPLAALVRIPPVYPIRAKRRKIQGYVDIEFLVTKKGDVKQIRIIKSQPEGVFDKNVINCVSQWKFRPGTVEGVSVDAMAQTTIRFEMEKQ